MFGFTRTTPITLYAFTSVPTLAEVFPPVELTKCVPDWWRSLPSYANVTLPKEHAVSRPPTIKHCYALQQLFKCGIGLRLWRDHFVTLAADGTVVADAPNGAAVRIGMTHPTFQFPQAFNATTQHYKFFSPWSFVCEQPVHFTMTHPIYHQRDPFRFHTMTGVVEYRHQHSTAINVLLPRVPDQRIELSFAAGEMMAYLLPMSPSPIKVIAEEISQAEMDRVNAAKHFSFFPLVFNRRHGLPPYIPESVRNR
jgi:hypothetical protein